MPYIGIRFPEPISNSRESSPSFGSFRNDDQFLGSINHRRVSQYNHHIFRRALYSYRGN